MDAFVDSNALVNDWVSQDLDVLARFARVEVKGHTAGTGTQAQELEIHGVPEAPPVELYPWPARKT
ncbi:MAG: hypothetical protein R3C68_01710 [Myxococcota bacterium]